MIVTLKKENVTLKKKNVTFKKENVTLKKENRMCIRACNDDVRIRLENPACRTKRTHALEYRTVAHCC